METERSSRGAESTRADAVRDALRDVRVQLSVLNHRIGGRVQVRDTDFDCLDLISIHGPLTPSRLAKLSGTRPATMTGILDRLERGGWIIRDRDTTDRRAIFIRVLPDRDSEVLGLYAGMNMLIDELCSDYDDTQLDTIAAFLRRVHDAGVQATAALTNTGEE